MELLHAVFSIFSERSAFFVQLLVEHLWISGAAIGIAVVLGGTAGILIHRYERAAAPTLGMVNFLYTIPSISMLGFLIPFFGIGNRAAIIALTIYALLPMVRATHTGLAQVAPSLREAAASLGDTPLRVLLYVQIPLAMPVIMTGIRSMATMTIALAGIASFIGAGGLGVAIYRGITTNNPALTIAGSLLIAVLALVMDGVLGQVEACLKRPARITGKVRAAYAGAAAVLLIAVSTVTYGFFSKADIVHIATKPMTEQLIMGEMLKLVIEHDAGLEARITAGVGGGTSNIHPGMESGAFDIYPEYTGTGWNMVLKEASKYSEELFPQLTEEYERRFAMRWVGMYGFNDTFGIVVRREIAEQYDLHTYSDLRRVAPQLIFGAEYDFFERTDGYPALCKEYGLHFAHTADLDIGLKYQALANGQIDVMTVFTTDGQLTATDVRVLTDDRNFFPSYRCGNVVRADVLERHPELVPVLEKLTDLISDEEMAQMNYAVETEGKEPRAVAEAFLRAKARLK
ncbi:glycine betaine ABC transporter substrate-binding protein [uncultured Selenomonas sp.]|uniref:ABC transporter permease/substrate-binding protein n=1 Tax=uncultured Selenomonas sp. TaxID=159275 RepID=UPI0028D22C4D|nr:glycine betaine ABC transporter substrate-binding protein [uncultured Selenomonas sp.]